MSRGKKLLAMVLALVILAGAAGVAKYATKGSAEIAETEPVVVCSVDSEGAEALNWTYGGETVALSKGDAGWQLAENAAFPLNVDTVTGQLSSLEEITASKVIEDAEDLNQYGLETPACTVTVTAAEPITISFGDVTELSGEQYCSIGDGNVYLVDSSIADSFECGLYDVVQKETLPDMSDLTSFTVENGEGTMVIDYLEDSGIAYDDSYVWFLEDGDGYVTLDTALTATYTETVTALSLGDCVSWNASAEELAAYGLDHPDAVVTVAYIKTEETESASETSAAEGSLMQVETPCSFTMEFSSGYCRIAGSGMIYELDETTGNTICHTTERELLPDEVLIQDWANVNSVDITINGETYNVEQVTREEEAEVAASDVEETGEQTVSDSEDEAAELETVWMLKDETIDIGSALSLVTGMGSTGCAAGLEPEHAAELELVIHRAGNTHRELQLTFYAYNSEACLVTMNGEATVLVAREDVVALVESLNSLLLEA